VGYLLVPERFVECISIVRDDLEHLRSVGRIVGDQLDHQSQALLQYWNHELAGRRIVQVPTSTTAT